MTDRPPAIEIWSTRPPQDMNRRQLIQALSDLSVLYEAERKEAQRLREENAILAMALKGRVLMRRKAVD